MYEVSVEYTFAAGHALRNYKGKCENVHGHNYKLRVTIGGKELNSTGLLVDFVDVRDAIKALVDRLDHRFLNDLPPFDHINPSAERLTTAQHPHNRPASNPQEAARRDISDVIGSHKGHIGGPNRAGSKLEKRVCRRRTQSLAGNEFAQRHIELAPPSLVPQSV